MKTQKFIAVIFLSTVIFFLCLGVVSYIAKKTNDFVNYDEEKIAAPNIDWAKLYPFDDADVPHDNTEENPIEKIFSHIKEKCEEYSSTRLLGFYHAAVAAKSYEELIGWNMAAVNGYNPVIKLNDGYLSGLAASRDVSENAEAVKELNDFCRDLGIEYTYINLPVKICISEDKDISGILDFSNKNADRLLDAIGRAGVKYYDFRKILHSDGIKHHEAFFRTDHHWRQETGMWAAKHILGILRDDYGWKVDPELLNPDRFDHKIDPEWFLGSQGKKITLARTKPDDFTMLYPKFRTLIRFEVLSRGIDTSGDFAVTYEMRHVERKDYYALNPYAAYKYADRPLTRIHNLLNHDGRKILFIHDSVSNCVIPFVGLGIEYTDEIDLRHFTGSLQTYIKASRPDIVITAYYSSIPGRTRAAEYPNNKFYDFR